MGTRSMLCILFCIKFLVNALCAWPPPLHHPYLLSSVYFTVWSILHASEACSFVDSSLFLATPLASRGVDEAANLGALLGSQCPLI